MSQNKNINSNDSDEIKNNDINENNDENLINNDISNNTSIRFRQLSTISFPNSYIEHGIQSNHSNIFSNIPSIFEIIRMIETDTIEDSSIEESSEIENYRIFIRRRLHTNDDTNNTNESIVVDNNNNILEDGINTEQKENIEANEWRCHFCQITNNFSDAICNRCRYLPYDENEQSTWICPVCNAHSIVNNCNICGTLSYMSGDIINFSMLSNMTHLFNFMNIVRRPQIMIENFTPVKQFIEPINMELWNKMKIIKYTKSICLEEKLCPICIDIYKEKDTIVILSCCRRSSHKECLEIWFLEKHKCPFCNYNYDYERIEKKKIIE